MPRDDHAVELIEAWRPRRRQNIITALTTLPQGWISARKHQRTTAITTVWAESLWAFPESYTAWSCARAMVENGETKGVINLPQGEFLHNYYTFVSLHECDHEGVVTILVALSCELWSSFIYIALCYIISSGNRTPGSRFYSDLLDTSVASTSSYSSVFQSARLLV